MGKRGIPLGSKMSAEPSLDEPEEECPRCGQETHESCKSNSCLMEEDYIDEEYEADNKYSHIKE